MANSGRKTIVIENAAISDFLDKCGRKQGAIIEMALSEFVERYSLSDQPESRLKLFIENYDFIKEARNNTPTIIVQMGSVPVIAAPPVEVEMPREEEKTQEDATREVLNEVAAMFGDYK